jgi:hypothetical protein
MEPIHLGELVTKDRIRLNLNQADLSDKLNNASKKPINPYTKKSYRFNRSWLAKLETGNLTRGFSDDIRIFLKKNLEGDEKLYLTLPITIRDSKMVLRNKDKKIDILPLIKEIVNKGKMKTLTFEQLVALHNARSSLRTFNLDLFQ